jgi:flagellar L-ring protein FlgH
MQIGRRSKFQTCALMVLVVSPICCSVLNALKPATKTTAQLRADYVTKLQQQNSPPAEERTVGSLWSAQAPLGDFSVDYKARRLNDTITIQIAVQTTAAQSGTVDSERTFTTNSAITGIMGRSPVATNPLLAANSATSLKGQVIAVLPNGNLVVEAERQIFMNNQHENVVVRGVLRPGDVGPGNIVQSTALSNLEVEMKGKGIISDGTRPPNFITKAVLWLFGF